MTVGAKNNYTRAIKLDLTFFSFGFLFLKFSLVFLAAVDKTRNMEHSGTCRNIPEHSGTSRNMKKFLKF